MTPLHNIRNQQDIEKYRRHLYRQLRKKEGQLQQDMEGIRASLSMNNLLSVGVSYIFRHIGSSLQWFLTGFTLFRHLFSKK